MTRRPPRGSALITALGMTTLLLSFVMALMAYANQERQRAIIVSRKMERLSCAEAGLQLARGYFGRNFASWNTYLANPTFYNPVGPSSNNFNLTPADPSSTTLQASYPQLFADLDGDGKSDVYIYIRDNQDEFLPLLDNWARDNDQNVIVGAICISQTLAPRLNGKQDPSQARVEALLSYNASSAGCSQANAGDGSGNCN